MKARIKLKRVNEYLMLLFIDFNRHILKSDECDKMVRKNSFVPENLLNPTVLLYSLNL